jgi:adenylate kinase
MIIFMGVAGSGKSSQGRKLADEEGLPWLSTGEFLRMLIAGDKRKDMVAGKLLGDQQIISLVRKIFHVINTDDEFVLDGFPRTLAQADWLLGEVKHGQLSITAVIHLKASRQLVSERLLKRARPDDNQQAIAERFKEYEEASLPIIKHFQDAGIRVIDIDGDQPVKIVHDAIKAALNSKV